MLLKWKWNLMYGTEPVFSYLQTQCGYITSSVSCELLNCACSVFCADQLQFCAEASFSLPSNSPCGVSSLHLLKYQVSGVWGTPEMFACSLGVHLSGEDRCSVIRGELPPDTDSRSGITPCNLYNVQARVSLENI